MTKLRTFQKQFIKAVENPRYGTVAISEPRSLGLSAAFMRGVQRPSGSLLRVSHEGA